MRIDFGAKKTEYEWSKSFDKFWLNYAPRWFEWLNWLVILGGLTFLQNKTNDSYLSLITTISYIILFFYIQAFFYSIEFVGIQFLEKYTKLKRTLLLIISGIVTMGLYNIFIHIIQLFKVN